MDRVIAIVVTFKRKELLIQVINSLLGQTTPPSTILIVDNNSQDGTTEVVKNISIKNQCIKYHDTGNNLGGAGGFHRGFKLAQTYDYDYLWLMDDDLLPDLDCLENLLIGKPEGIVQPVRFCLSGDCVEMSPVVYDLNKFFCKNPKLYSVADVYSSFKGKNYINIATVPFEGPLIHKSVVEKIGLPNPKFFITGDDTDYSLRASNAGFPIKCFLNARASRLLIHNQDNDLFTWKGYFILRNHFYILRKYGANKFVKKRWLVILCYVVLKSALRLDFKTFKIAFSAYLDSFTLKNNDKYKP